MPWVLSLCPCSRETHLQGPRATGVEKAEEVQTAGWAGKGWEMVKETETTQAVGWVGEEACVGFEAVAVAVKNRCTHTCMLCSQAQPG